METRIHIKDYVQLPFEEIGIVVKILNNIWGSKYIVKIIKASSFNNVGDEIDFKESQVTKLPKYLVRPDDFHIFEIDKTNGCYRSYLLKKTKNFPHAYEHFTYEHLTKNYGWFPITSKQIPEYREKNHDHIEFICWQQRSDGHDGVKGGTYAEFLEYKENIKEFYNR